jgi:hypothetical protein
MADDADEVPAIESEEVRRRRLARDQERSMTAAFSQICGSLAGLGDESRTRILASCAILFGIGDEVYDLLEKRS